MHDYIYVGIDPGASGGIGVCQDGIMKAFPFSHETESSISLLFHSMAIKNELCVGKVFAFLENVHAFPGQGVSSTFKFGRNFGMLEGFLIAHQIPYELVQPQKWQKAMGCLTKGDKNVSKRMAERLFPKIKITHAVADALLICEYGRRMTNLREGIGGDVS